MAQLSKWLPKSPPKDLLSLLFNIFMALQYMIGCLSASLKLISGKFNVVATSKNGCQNGLQDLENAIISFFNVFGVAVT